MYSDCSSPLLTLPPPAPLLRSLPAEVPMPRLSYPQENPFSLQPKRKVILHPLLPRPPPPGPPRRLLLCAPPPLGHPRRLLLRALPPHAQPQWPLLRGPPPAPPRQLRLRVTPTRSIPGSRVQVRSVWSWNLQQELFLIGSLLPRYPLVSMDTEFPGQIYDSRKPYYRRTPDERYSIMKKNVDDLSLIQLGLTLFDVDGQLPDLGIGGAASYIWEFNFKDFDIENDDYAPEAIELLKSHGLDFHLFREFGIDSADFADLFYSCMLAFSCIHDLTWISFSGSYDFGYLVKILTGAALPKRLEDFLDMIYPFFGREVFDVKHMARFCGDGIPGGLEHVASFLGAVRVGVAHNAGSDSLLTSSAYLRMVNCFFGSDIDVYAGSIDGLV